MDETVDTDAKDDEAPSASAEQGEELPSTDMPPEEEELIPEPPMEVFDWNTSLVSQVSIVDLSKASLHRYLYSSVEKGISLVYVRLLNTVNRCPLAVRMHRQSLIIWKWKLDFPHCTMPHAINA